MNSSQVLLVNSILQALIKGFEFEYPYCGEKVFVQFFVGKFARKIGCILIRTSAVAASNSSLTRTYYKIWYGDADLQFIITAGGKRDR